MKNILILLLLFITLRVVAQDSEEIFEVYNVKSEEDGSTVVYANNGYLCDETVLVTFIALRNMKADVELPYKGLVPAGAKGYKLFTLTIKDQTKDSQLGYRFKFCHGDAFNGRHDNTYVYTIPYQEGEQYPLDQGYGGKFSHFMKGKKYALDFTMDKGTPVCAARDGVVIEVKDDSNKGGKSSKFQEYGNYITVYHKDGTMADYFHLNKGGSKVEEGDNIEAGEVIALSGNTGWSSGPHLHFQVFSFDEDMKVKTLPTKFRQEEGKTMVLQKSKKGYKSVH